MHRPRTSVSSAATRTTSSGRVTMAISLSYVPYKPKKFLSISMGGVKENDFVMVMGYPGSTRRYRESYSVAYNQDIAIPFQIDVFNKQIEELQNAGKSDPELQLKLQSRIFEIANTLKDLEGSVVAMRRFGVVDQKRTEETAFTRWLSANPDRQKKYGEVLPSLQQAYDELMRTAQRDLIVQQLAEMSDLFQILSLVNRVVADKQKPQGERNATLAMTALRARGALPEILAARNGPSERTFRSYSASYKAKHACAPKTNSRAPSRKARTLQPRRRSPRCSRGRRHNSRN
ncbi:MAG: hypothetical protein DMF70_03490 [Acidobacteria bacterium]|nr:MAG: hypothetical protein DMF70_03490 [Acidobacteriota bacterium]